LLNWLYNRFLNQKIELYKFEKKSISKFDLQNQLPALKSEFPDLKEIHSQVIQSVATRLDKTYKSFFSRKYGFPKFRSCKNFFGIQYNTNGYKFENNQFITKVYGNIQIVKHREIIGNIKQVQITSKNDNWYLSVVTDHNKELTDNQDVIGIDLGITNLVATSNGTIIKNKRHSKYFDKQINSLKSRRDKCKKGSRKFKFYNRKILLLYDVKNRKVNDFQHKISKNLTSNYGTIIIEDLDLKKMSESKITGLNRELRNSQLGNFISKLIYKAFKVLKVNPFNTSKTCNKCGNIKNIPLSNRVYSCQCGYVLDRDVNAAKNIFCLGQAILSRGCSAITLQEALSFRVG